MPAAAVAVAGLTRRYRTGSAVVQALAGITLSVEPGTAVAVTGPSGSGKSTLLHLVGAMDTPSSGTITVGDTRVDRLSRNELTVYRRSVGFVFQSFHLLPALSALDNVLAPVLPRRVAYDKRARAQELLAAVGLAERSDALPSQLSGGQQQRVAIARALINEPRLVLADEPTGNLDSTTGAEILDLLLDLRRSNGATLLIATHDPTVAARTNRIIRLRDGTIQDDTPVTGLGSPDALLRRIGMPGPT